MTTTLVPTPTPTAVLPSITTPDRRVRVFVSSTLTELAAERRAARAAVTTLHLSPVMFETGARTHPPRELYRAYLGQSDVFVGIYWQSYGWIAPDEDVSGLEDEYRLAGDRPKLIYVKDSDARDPALVALLRRIQLDDRAAYKHFADAGELIDLLADDLAVLLTERFSAAAPDVTPGLREPRIPVPPTGIVGREEEITTVAALLQDASVRLVTLVGPGGIGKTRLALAIADTMTTAEPSPFDGVWFVDLTAVTDPGSMLAAVAAALGVRQEGTGSYVDLFADRLAGRHVLLVLDNFEQVVGAATELAAVLSACPGVTVLVTSRSVLRLRGEREVSLAPLATPAESGPVDLATIARSAAVQLFVLRGHQVRDGFALTEANAAAVAELCRRLDGVPLALELAAAQLRLLGPETLLRRLGDRLDRSLDLTAGPVDLPRRQHTLRATIDWSYSLLTEPERVLLDRLSVFVDAWTLEAAEAVGGPVPDGDATGSEDIMATLASLVAQSLVFPHERDAAEPRFRMLGAVRAYAGERLTERRAEAGTLARLTSYVRDFSERAGYGLGCRENRAWAVRVDAELGDLRTVTDRALRDDDAETVVRVTAPLFTYWWSHGRLAAMRELAERAAGLPSAATLSPEASALLLWARGMFRISAGDAVGAEPLLRHLLDAATTLADDRLRAHALAGLGLARAGDDAAEGRRLLADAVQLFRIQDDRWGLCFALSSAGQVALQDQSPDDAATMHTEALTIATDIENRHLQAQLLDQLGFDTFAVGDVGGARDRFTASAALHVALRDQEGSAYCLDGLAAVALAQGRHEVAAQLLGASGHARDVVGVAVWPAMQPVAAAMAAAVRGALGERTFDLHLARGAALRTTDALATGLAETALARTVAS